MGPERNQPLLPNARFCAICPSLATCHHLPSNFPALGTIFTSGAPLPDVYQQYLPLDSPSRSIHYQLTPQRDNTPPSPTPSQSTTASSTPVPEEVPKKVRIRVTKDNAVFGDVEGAMRGSRAFSFPRARELRAPQEEQKKSSQRFLREIQDIIDRCERLSLETGCWLQLSAQHLFASGGFLHYTSPRLRKEAKPEVEKITTDLNRLYLKLIAARHQDTRAMQEKLQQAEQSQKLAESSLATVQQAEAEARDRAQLAELRLEAQRKELDILRKQMERTRK